MLNRFKFFSPEGVGGAEGTEGTTVQSDVDFLTPQEEAPVEEKKEEVKEETSTEEETKEETTEEESTEEKEEKEEVIEEDQALVRVSYQDLKTKHDGKYKDLFKDFPELKGAFFREQAYSQVFNSIEEAKTAAETVERFDSLVSMTLGGDSKSFLNQVNDASPKALVKFSENFLPSLAEISTDAYRQVVTPVIKGILRDVLEHGQGLNDEDIQNAAKLAAQVIFGPKSDLGKAETKKSDEPTDDEKKFRQEQNDFYANKYKELYTSVSTDLATALSSEVEKGLDPTNSLRPGLKKILSEKICAEVGAQLQSDAQHMKRMSDLWNKEQRAGFSGANKESLKVAFLSRAKALIPSIRAKIRAEVVDTQKADDKATEKKIAGTKKVIPAGQTAHGGKTRVTVKEAREKGMSDMDIIMSGAES